MNKTNFTQAVIVLSILFFAASCRSIHTHPSYSTQEERPLAAVPKPHHLPPGQEKKIYGDRSAKNNAPGQRKKYGYGDHQRYIPLIIIRAPDIVISTNGNGRYYYRDPQGYYYWKGYDDRFYLEDQYLDRVSYDEREYGDWKYKGKRYHDVDNNDDRKDHGPGHKMEKYKKRKD